MQELDYHCLILIRQRFGDVSHQVARAILEGPYQTIPDLLKSTNLHIETICNVLTAFMQHDLLVLHPPRRVPRPPKRLAAARKKKMQDSEDTHDYPAEVVPYPPILGAPTTRVYGNQASGYIPGLQTRLESIRSLGVHRPIVPFRVMQHDPGLNIKTYRYTLNVDMVRGLARCGLYSAFCLEFFNDYVRAVIDEFGFRGKLTLLRAFELVLNRVVEDQDFIRRTNERSGGIDPEYTADDFNALATPKLQEMSIYAFNRARLLADIKPHILLAMDKIEEKRYIDTLPSIINAFTVVFDHHLLTHSRGFHDPNAQISNALPDIVGSSSSGSQSMSDLIAAAADHSIRKKRRTLNGLDGAPAASQPASRQRTAASGSGKPNNSIRLILDDDSDDYGHGDGDSITSASASASTALSSGGVSDSTTLFILNHDRFTMYFRGELLVDHLARCISPFAGIIGGAISFYITSRSDSFLEKDLTGKQIQDAVTTYVAIKFASNPQLRIPQQQRDNLHNIDSLFKITTLAIAYNYTQVCGLTHDQLAEIMTRLCQRNYAYELSDYREKKYGLVFDVITQDMRSDYTVQHVFTRHGQNGARIFRLLQDVPRLEEKQISDFSLIPKREVKEIVHSLMRDGLVELMEVPTSADRLNNSKAFYLFGINYQLAGVTMAKIFLKTYANLSARLLAERKYKELIVDKGVISQHIELTIREEQLYHEYRDIYTRIVQVLGAVIKPIILFYDLLPQ